MTRSTARRQLVGSRCIDEQATTKNQRVRLDSICPTGEYKFKQELGLNPTRYESVEQCSRAGTQPLHCQYELCDKNSHGINVYNGFLAFRHFAVVIYKYGIPACCVMAICWQLLGLFAGQIGGNSAPPAWSRSGQVAGVWSTLRPWSSAREFNISAFATGDGLLGCR